MRTFEIPHEGAVRLDHLVLDLNGTLSDRGALIPNRSSVWRLTFRFTC
jgi:hypothetical protein